MARPGFGRLARRLSTAVVPGRIDLWLGPGSPPQRPMRQGAWSRVSPNSTRSRAGRRNLGPESLVSVDGAAQPCHMAIRSLVQWPARPVGAIRLRRLSPTSSGLGKCLSAATSTDGIVVLNGAPLTTLLLLDGADSWEARRRLDMQLPHSTWQSRKWQIAVLVVGVLMPTAWIIVTRLSMPSDGTLLQPTPGQNAPVIAQVFVAGANLQAGDRVLAIDTVPVDEWVSGSVTPLQTQPGDVVTYRLDRVGTIIDADVQLQNYPFADALDTDGILLLLIFVLLILGGGAFLARPGDPAAVAIVVVALALLWAITEFPLGLQVVDIARGGLGITSYVGADIGACVMWGGLLSFVLLFPEPPSLIRRRPWLIMGCYMVAPLLYGISLIIRLPSAGPTARLFDLITISTTAAILVPVLVVVRLTTSYFQSRDSDDRRRLRWIFISLLVGIGAYLSLIQVPAAIGGLPLLPFQWVGLAFIPIPIAVVVGILRYRLFDIEVVLTRSLLVGALTAIVVLGYALVLVIIPELNGVTGQQAPFALLLIGGAVAAAAFGLRRRLSRRVTALVYGHRNDPHALVEELGRLDSAADADRLLPDVVRTLAQALRLPYARLVLLGPDGLVQSEATHGAPVREPTVLPIKSNDQTLGELALDVGPGREPFGPADRRLLDDLTRQLAEVCRTVLLTRALQQSRERLVLAREEERRRLRRDLHDGIGPSLAALGMQMELASALVHTDPELTAQKLQSSVDTVRQLINDVRRVVDDLRPPALDQFGLVGAIRQNTRGLHRPATASQPGFNVEVVPAGNLTDLPAAVEVAAFRIAVEAVTNAAKYSGGSTCTVSLHGGDNLTMAVEDNGQGLQSRVQGTGVGLASMRERAAELGGTCVIHTRPVGGTAVRVQLPTRTGRRE